MRWIKGFEGHYKIDKIGDVYSCKEVVKYKDGRVAKNFTTKKIKQGLNHKGYPVVYLSVNSKKHTLTVHRLMARTYLKNPDSKKYDQINHIDGCKQNNILENLEWSNNSLNQLHAYANGLNKSSGQKGELNGSSIMKEKQVFKCRELYKTGNYTYQKLADKYGVAMATISDIIKKERGNTSKEEEMNFMDLTEVKDTGGDFEPIPAGEYPCYIDRCEWKMSKAGSKYLNVMFKIVGDQYANRVVFNIYNLLHPKDNVKNIALSDLKRLMVAGGYDESALKFSSEEDLVAKLLEVRCKVRLGIKKQEGYSDSNSIKGYKPLEELTGAENAPF